LSEGAGRDWAQIYIRLRQDANDAVAMDALVQAVAAWARSDLSNASDREDVVAETCATAVLGLDRAYGAETFDGFVRGHYFNARRRVSQRSARSALPLDTVDMPSPPAVEVHHDELALLQRCLAELPARMRRAVELRYFNGASAQDIARELGVSTPNARQIVSRGLASLQRCAQRTWPLGREWPL
jgi:RNA polymerase sigma factor (sigma-70 family)